MLSFGARATRRGGALAAVVVALTTSLLALGTARAQSIEELELKKAEADEAESSGLNLGFGLQALLENGTGINRDRPTSYSYLFLAPQLKLMKTLRVQANMNFVLNHLERQDDPWDLPDWSLQVADLSLWKEDFTGIGFSGYLRWSFPTSIGSRVRDRYGALRANLKASRAFGPVYLSFELNGLRYFHKYTSSDPERWQEEGNIIANPAWGLNERVTVSYSPTQQLSLSAIWGMTQVTDEPGRSDALGGSSYLSTRRTDVAEHSFSGILDLTYALSDVVYLSGGYSIDAPQLQNGGHDRSLNPFNEKYAQLYVDLMLVY